MNTCHFSSTCSHIFHTRNLAATVPLVVSLLTMTAISVDRLQAVLLGLRYRQVVTFKRVYVAVIALWVYSSFGVAVSWVQKEDVNYVHIYECNDMCYNIPFLLSQEFPQAS